MARGPARAASMPPVAAPERMEFHGSSCVYVSSMNRGVGEVESLSWQRHRIAATDTCGHTRSQLSPPRSHLLPNRAQRAVAAREQAAPHGELPPHHGSSRRAIAQRAREAREDAGVIGQREADAGGVAILVLFGVDLDLVVLEAIEHLGEGDFGITVFLCVYNFGISTP